ncbi:uncharacterized protein LOC135392111 [Ornithodoros turicata]|uniref:uncharacterized protein LOC135392111 n=1 Tax=Ornithodoros turicata TaxID=34597 RepID=UPI0031390CE5
METAQGTATTVQANNVTAQTSTNVTQTAESPVGICNATTFYFGATLLLSLGSTVGLLVGFLSDHWEYVDFDADTVSDTAARQGVALTRSSNVLRLSFGPSAARPRGFNGSVAYLVNLRGGVNRICANVDENDLAFLGEEAKKAPVGCISYFRTPDEDYHRKQVIIKYPWLDKMRNLAMSCSIVSLILIGASFLVGGFGIFKRQLSAVMVTGVMFILAAGKEDMQCRLIDYFPKEEYSPDPNDSTMAIPYAVKRAAAFIVMSALVLVVGELLCFLGHLIRRGRVLTFAGGISFILSGLMILVGMVIYISTFKAEVGSKLRPKSSFQEPLFTYNYGYSFLLAVTGLMSCELAGTFSIFLCIHRYQQELKKKMERQKADPVVDHLPGCRRHRRHSSGSGSHHHHHGSARRNSRAVESLSDSSPTTSGRRSERRSPHLPMSESMRDLSYYNFPPFSRDTTCNTVSTTADNLTRDYSRDFSFETLRRTTPV